VELKPQKFAKQHPKSRQKSGKEQEKVAETAENPKTASTIQPNSRKRLGKK